MTNSEKVLALMKDSERIPVKAWFGLALVLAAMFAALFI